MWTQASHSTSSDPEPQRNKHLIQHQTKTLRCARFSGAGPGWRVPRDTSRITGRLGFIFSLKKGKSPEQAFGDTPHLTPPPGPSRGQDSSALEQGSDKTKKGTDHTEIDLPLPCRWAHTSRSQCVILGISSQHRPGATPRWAYQILAAMTWLAPKVIPSRAPSCPTGRGNKKLFNKL